MASTIVFRADASLQIGSGHVMRCLTLATALREHGVVCHFICREHPGDLINQIRDLGFAVTALVTGSLDLQAVEKNGESLPAHAAWLGVDWQTDAEATRDVLQPLSPDWLVVDHYALDRAWEQALRPHCAQLMVIDDLADRPHDCDLLLDQNLGRAMADYAKLVPATSKVLTGTRYALLRPEFAALRDYSLRRRHPPKLQQLLINMGGVDQADATGQVLETLRQCPLPQDCHITVVMGLNAPWLATVLTLAADLPWPCEVKVNVNDMAQLMADSDLAIGAAGGTSWERCVLGLPTLIVVVAANQKPGAMALTEAHAAVLLNDADPYNATVLSMQLETLDGLKLARLSKAASDLVDGSGTRRVVASMLRPDWRVRSMRNEDLADVLQWRNHPDVRRFMYTQHEIGLAEHRIWYEQVSQDQRRHLLIVEDGRKSVGFVQLTEEGCGEAKWGFYAAPSMPKGSGRRLGVTALNYAFLGLGFHKVCGEAIAFNHRSINLHRNLGFRDAGVLQDKYFDGSRYYDVYRFELLASEWREQHQEMKL